jgi:hypothetical protein
MAHQDAVEGDLEQYVSRKEPLVVPERRSNGSHLSALYYP